MNEEERKLAAEMRKYVMENLRAQYGMGGMGVMIRGIAELISMTAEATGTDEAEIRRRLDILYRENTP